MKTRLVRIVMCSLGALVVLVGCGDAGGGLNSCAYEERTTSCGGGDFGPWEERCSPIDFELREGLTAESFCNSAYSGSDLECAAGCCVSFEFRNTRVVSGGC